MKIFLTVLSERVVYSLPLRANEGDDTFFLTDRRKAFASELCYAGVSITRK